MRKLFFILKYYLTRFLAYRLRVVIWALVDIIHFLIFPFIWFSVYGTRTEIAGFTRADMVTYYIILALVAVGFTSHIGRHVRQEIMQGDLNKVLVRPEPHFLRCFISETGYKCMSTCIALAIGFVIWLATPQYLIFPHSLLTWTLFAIALVLAFAISQCIEYAIGLSSFWLGETRALNHTTEILTLIFSGAIAPLSFYPAGFQIAANYLPFKFMGYIPAQIYLGQLTTQEIAFELALATGWIAMFGIIIYVTWKKGLKIYEGVGI